MNKECYNNAMRLESYDLAAFARKLYDLNKEQVWNVLSDDDYQHINRVIATGCGDSYCAALAAQYVFRELTGEKAYGLTAMDVSRFFDSRNLKDTLFLGVSSRGRTSRVVEAAMRVKKLGYNCKSIAIVNAPTEGSELEKECDCAVPIIMPKFECGVYNEMAPYQRRYYSTMFILILFAIRMGVAKGKYDRTQAEKYTEDVLRYTESFNHKVLDLIDIKMWNLAQKWSNIMKYEVVASSKQQATAWFSAAKSVEAFGAVSTYDDAGNWLSSNIKISGQDIASILYVSKDDPQEKLLVSTAFEMSEHREHLLIITDIQDLKLPVNSEVVRIPTGTLKWAKPLMQYCPLGCLCGYIAKIRGANFYRRGPGDIHEIEKIHSNISESIINQPLVLIK